MVRKTAPASLEVVELHVDWSRFFTPGKMTAIAMIDLPGTRTNRQTPRDLVCALAVQIIGQRRQNLFVASDDSYDVRSYREAVGRHGQEVRQA
jgi:hypothetical protein